MWVGKLKKLKEKRVEGKGNENGRKKRWEKVNKKQI